MIFCLDATTRSQSKTDTRSFGVAAKHVGQALDRYYALEGFLQYDEVDIHVSGSTKITNLPPGLPILPAPVFSMKDTISGIRKTGINGTWYPRQNLGISAGYLLSDTRSDQDQTYILEGSWFIVPKLELRLHASKTDLEGPRDNIARVGLGFSGRI